MFDSTSGYHIRACASSCPGRRQLTFDHFVATCVELIANEMWHKTRTKTHARNEEVGVQASTAKGGQACVGCGGSAGVAAAGRALHTHFGRTATRNARVTSYTYTCEQACTTGQQTRVPGRADEGRWVNGHWQRAWGDNETCDESSSARKKAAVAPCAFAAARGAAHEALSAVTASWAVPCRGRGSLPLRWRRLEQWLMPPSRRGGGEAWSQTMCHGRNTATTGYEEPMAGARWPAKWLPRVNSARPRQHGSRSAGRHQRLQYGLPGVLKMVAGQRRVATCRWRRAFGLQPLLYHEAYRHAWWTSSIHLQSLHTDKQTKWVWEREAKVAGLWMPRGRGRTTTAAATHAPCHT